MNETVMKEVKPEKEIKKEPAKKQKPIDKAKPIVFAALVIGIIATYQFGVVGSDALTADAISARAAAFNSVPPELIVGSIDYLNPAVLSETLPLTGLDSSSQNQLRTDVQAGNAALHVLHMFDDSSVDGDTVLVSSGSDFKRVVMLTATPQPIGVPSYGAGAITVTGLRSEMDGVTASLVTPAGVLPLPLLALGESISLATP